MATSNIQDLIKGLCKLYKGGENPYHPDQAEKDRWVDEYFKFQIWDAESSAVKGASQWTTILGSSIANMSKAEKAEEIYKRAILDKLNKMQRDDIDFTAMYFKL